MKKRSWALGAAVSLLQGAAAEATGSAPPTLPSQHPVPVLEAVVLRDDPPKADYNEETRLGDLPVTLEALIAFAWILMVASMPLIPLRFEGRKISRTQVCVFTVMWISFLGGVWLFTNVLYFKSAHWEGERSLTIVECVYLMSQILTTVGYGDIVPAHPRAQVFVALYVLFTLMVIANVVSEVSNMVSEHTQNYYSKLQDVALGFKFPGQVLDEKEQPSSRRTASQRRHWVQTCVPHLPTKELAAAILVYIIWCAIGVLFFVSYPGEGKTLFQGIYMSVITLSTVGFGAFTPVTEVGKAFGAFWMLFGSTALVTVVSRFTELMAVAEMRERFIKGVTELETNQAFEKLPDRVNYHDFLRFALLESHMCEEKILNDIDSTFAGLGPKQGMLPKRIAEQLLEPKVE